MTTCQLDALIPALQRYFQDQSSYWDDGHMTADCDKSGLTSKADQLESIASFCCENGLNYTAGRYTELAREIREFASALA